MQQRTAPVKHRRRHHLPIRRTICCRCEVEVDFLFRGEYVYGTCCIYVYQEGSPVIGQNCEARYAPHVNPSFYLSTSWLALVCCSSARK